MATIYVMWDLAAFVVILSIYCRKQFSIMCNSAKYFSVSWSRVLRRGSAAARWLGLRVGLSPAALMYVCCECCVLSSRGLCDELITSPEESYQLWCVWVQSRSLDFEALAYWRLSCQKKCYLKSRKWQETKRNCLVRLLLCASHLILLGLPYKEKEMSRA
jgi:hypothetical protein